MTEPLEDFSRTEYCLTCGEAFELPKKAGRPKKYCSESCRAKMRRSVKKEYDETSIETARKRMRQLAFENLNDEVREVLRQEIRDQITQAVHDTVLGAAEVMVEMLPTALAGIKQDLESDDWVARSRAYALLMKYAMSFGTTDPNETASQNIVVVSGVPTPDTALGHAVVEKYEALPVVSGDVPPDTPEEDLEDFEREWKKCGKCGSRKPDGVMKERTDRPGHYVCNGCITKNHYRASAKPDNWPDSIMNNPLYGGD